MYDGSPRIGVSFDDMVGKNSRRVKADLVLTRQPFFPERGAFIIHSENYQPRDQIVKVHPDTRAAIIITQWGEVQ